MSEVFNNCCHQNVPWIQAKRKWSSDFWLGPESEQCYRFLRILLCNVRKVLSHNSAQKSTYSALWGPRGSLALSRNGIFGVEYFYILVRSCMKACIPVRKSIS